jgi:hypothetical protein
VGPVDTGTPEAAAVSAWEWVSGGVSLTRPRRKGREGAAEEGSGLRPSLSREGTCCWHQLMHACLLGLSGSCGCRAMLRPPTMRTGSCQNFGRVSLMQGDHLWRVPSGVSPGGDPGPCHSALEVDVGLLGTR